MPRVLAGLLAALAAGCVYSSDGGRRSPRAPRPASNSGIVTPGQRDKIPDTPYEVRKGEIERDRAIAGQSDPASRPSSPPLFKSQKNAPGGGS